MLLVVVLDSINQALLVSHVLLDVLPAHQLISVLSACPENLLIMDFAIPTVQMGQLQIKLL